MTVKQFNKGVLLVAAALLMAGMGMRALHMAAGRYMEAGGAGIFVVMCGIAVMLGLVSPRRSQLLPYLLINSGVLVFCSGVLMRFYSMPAGKAVSIVGYGIILLWCILHFAAGKVKGAKG